MTGIKKISLLILAVAAIPSTFALPAKTENTFVRRDCDCRHNGDAGRWDDRWDPSRRLADLCRKGGCYEAKAGRMCISGDLGQCGCAADAAENWQSWHGNWFLWSSITCGGLTVTLT